MGHLNLKQSLSESSFKTMIDLFQQQQASFIFIEY